MPHQLPADCLEDKHAYWLTVFWCEISVQILWTSIQNYQILIACLPNESKETFIQELEIEKILLKSRQPIILQNLEIYKNIVAQEIFKMFKNHISLKRLDFCSLYFNMSFGYLF